jgi:hypothetical protein
MSDRLTVVFDDPTLYRRIKVRAAEDSVPVKKLIEDALQRYLGPADGGRLFDFDAFQQWQAEVDESVEPEDDAATDLSDVKKHLYGYPGRETRYHQVAEESAEYDAR